MSIFPTVLVLIVAIEHFFIMYLETGKTSSKKTSDTFNIPEDALKNKYVNTLFKNQGVYNGCIGLSLIYGLFFSKNALEIVTLFLIFVLVVAVYGSITSSKLIILKQGGPAILALLSILFFH